MKYETQLEFASLPSAESLRLRPCAEPLLTNKRETSETPIRSRKRHYDDSFTSTTSFSPRSAVKSGPISPQKPFECSALALWRVKE